MSDIDAFAQNIEGVRQLVESDVNKAFPLPSEEGVVGEPEDKLSLELDDEELLRLRVQWKAKDDAYTPKIKTRQDNNKTYYKGTQRQSDGKADRVVPNNLIWEAEETYIPQALSRNPEPVVFSDNTEDGKDASNELKTMLQYHADTMVLRGYLGRMVRQHAIYFTAIIKHGWSERINDIKIDIRKAQNFMWDSNAYVDPSGRYCGEFLGERVETTAEELMEDYPKHRDYIFLKADGKLGTKCVKEEWWTDDYCFVAFEDIILDKFKNPFYNYSEKGDPLAKPNHFADPRMPYSFLSVYSLNEQPLDETSTIEQSVANQDRINDRDAQISRNLRSGNNSIALSGKSFTIETGKQAASALEDGDPVLVPTGSVEDAIKRIPANDIPSAVFTAQQNDKDSLRGIFGTQGLTAQNAPEQGTARGMILNQAHDSTRIGGGMGDAIERLADNVFNWWTQLYYVFYDEPKFAAVMGSGRAVEYVQLLMSNKDRHFVVSVAPNSMRPKDDISEQNLAIELANAGWLDPINLFKKLDYPDPMETAKMVTLFRINPQAYMQQFFPEQAQQSAMQPQLPGGQVPPQEGAPPGTTAAPPASASLSQVPISMSAMPK